MNTYIYIWKINEHPPFLDCFLGPWISIPHGNHLFTFPPEHDRTAFHRLLGADL